MATKPCTLYLTTKFPPAAGGAGSTAYKLAEELSTKYEIIVVTTSGGVGSSNFKVKNIWTPSHSTLKSLCFTVGANILAVFERSDIIHFHDLSSCLGFLLTNWAVKKKTILKYGGDFVYEYLSHKQTKNWNPSLGVKAAWRYNFWSRFLTRIERAALTKVDHIYTNSEYGITLLRELGIDRDIGLIKNGVDLNLFNPERYDRAKIREELELSGVVYFTAARLVPWKGIDVLIEAFSSLKDDESTLLIGGSGPDEVRLKKLARHNERVKFIGSIPWMDMPRYLSAVDVYVLPSLFDWCPNSLLEAMAMGKNVIATSVGGVSEIIEDGVDGLLIPPANVSALVEALQRVKDMNLGKNARKKIEREYNWKEMVLKIDKLYEEVLQR